MTRTVPPTCALFTNPATTVSKLVFPLPLGPISAVTVCGRNGVDIGRTLGPEAARSAVAVLMSAVTGSSGTMAEPSADASLDRLSFKTLRYLLHFCWELSAHEAVTKMGVSNLALVIAPNVMKVSRYRR